jgi:hypothetical protein
LAVAIVVGALLTAAGVVLIVPLPEVGLPLVVAVALPQADRRLRARTVSDRRLWALMAIQAAVKAREQ